MTRETLYNKTVDILVQAYFNDTLQHANCYACAVGNIVAANMGLQYEYGNKYKSLKWANVDSCYNNPLGMTNTWFDAINFDELNEEKYTGIVKQQIDCTGYTPYELIKIENAFEQVESSESEDSMFDGLMAVIDVLDQIHENTNATLTTSTKQRFVKATA